MTSNMPRLQEVLDHHIQAINNVNYPEIGADYAHDAIVIFKDSGVVRGRDAITSWFNDVLSGPLVGGKFACTTVIIESEVIYLEWDCEGTTNRASGVDAFIIRDGKIQAQVVKLLSLMPVVEADVVVAE